LPKLALINMIIGFTIIAFSASAGVFVANDTTYRFLENISPVWIDVISAAAHGHTSLFGLIQITFGLTLPYSRLDLKIKKYQTIFLAGGIFAMGPLMMLRGLLGPTTSIEWNGISIGILLSLWLTAIVAHAIGICLKLTEH
jgi:hypothetical protein